jgi:hypothetical protein
MEKEAGSTNVKKGISQLIDLGKERGYVTYDDINRMVPSDDVLPEDLKNAFNVLSENDIEIIEGFAEDAAESEDGGDAFFGEMPTGASTTRTFPRSRPRPRTRSRSFRSSPSRVARSAITAPTAPTRCACICRKWAASRSCRAKKKSRSRKRSRAGCTRSATASTASRSVTVT